MITLISPEPKFRENQKLIEKIVTKYQNPRRFILTNNWDDNYGNFQNLQQRVYRDFVNSKVLSVSAPFYSKVSQELTEDYFMADAPEMSVFVIQKGCRASDGFLQLPAVSIEKLLDCIVGEDMNIEAGMYRFLEKTDIQNSDFNIVLRSSNTDEVFVLNVNNPNYLSKLPIYLTLSQGSSMLLTTNYNYADAFRKAVNESIQTVTANEIFIIRVEKGDISIR